MKIISLSLITIVLLASGCVMPSQFETYKKSEDKAKEVLIQQNIRTAKMSQQIYKTQYGTYADSVDKLQDLGEAKDKIQIVRADESSYEMKYTEGDKVYTFKN